MKQFTVCSSQAAASILVAALEHNGYQAWWNHASENGTVVVFYSKKGMK